MNQHSPFDYSSGVLASLPRHSVSVAGIVVNSRGPVLAIRRRDNGHWQPPGGVLERHETFEQGVLREVAEETGAEVEVERLTGLYKNVKAGIVATVFRCRPLTELATETTEAAEVAWIEPADIGRLMTPTFTVRVLDAFEPVPQVRAHDGTHLLDATIAGGGATTSTDASSTSPIASSSAGERHELVYRYDSTT